MGAPTAGNNYAVTAGDLRVLETASYTFSGDSLSINAGRLLLQGTGSPTITVNDLRLGGGLILATASTTLAGNLSLNSVGSSIRSNSASNILTVSAAISGGSGLNLAEGRVQLSGNNSYTGGTTINGGSAGVVVDVLGSTTFGATTNALNVSSGAGTTQVNLSATADTTVGSLSGTKGAGANQIFGGGGSRLFTVNQTTSGTYAGEIRGGSTTFVLGSLSNSSLTLAGANAYTGSTIVNAGTLLVGDGTAGSVSTGTVTVNAGTLGGSRASGNNFGGAVVVGNSSGSADAILSAGTNGTTGRLASAGNLSLNSDADFVFDLVTTTGSVASDLFSVNGGTGTTTINTGAFFTLNATGDNSGLTVGQTFTVIDGSLFNGTSGVFSNLADGGTITGNGATFLASYAGGDLILTVTVVPEPGACALLVLGLTTLTIFGRRRMVCNS